MKTIIADAAWDGRRLTRFLQKALPAASMGRSPGSCAWGA